MKILVTPSILSADLAHLQEEVDGVASYADWLQVDVMDGHFVPNLSFGAPVMRCLKTSLPLDVHLMVTNPAERIKEFLEAGATNITFHAEAVSAGKDRTALIQTIHKGGATVGIALKPKTPLSPIKDCLAEVDLVLIMSVEPGFGGQEFLPEVLGKVRELHAKYPDLMIQMDGGINDVTAGECRAAGANNLVAGSYIFRAKDKKEAIASLRGI